MSIAVTSSSARANHYRKCVQTCLDNLLTYGTDRYGELHSAMLMSIIDVHTNECPQEPLLLDGWIRSDERPGRRNPAGSDLWDDQPLLTALYRFSEQSGTPKYAAGADAYVQAYFQHAIRPNGLIAWGSHLFFDGFTDQVDDDHHGNMHEILVHLAEWDAMWRLDPKTVQREIEGIWEWHIVDKTTGQHNRHDDRQVGCDFAFSGGSFAHAFAFLHKKTGDPIWLDRAKLIVNWHWRHRNLQTNLAPDAPSTRTRYDALHCFTSVVGPHVAAVIRCFELTGDSYFREVALAYIRAWITYAWDEREGKYFAAVKLDGTPVPDTEKGADYDAWMPTGYTEIWPMTTYSYELPLAAAQAFIYAYEVFKEPDLLIGAKHWARQIRESFPTVFGRRWRKELLAALPDAALKGGTYAEGYGRAMSFCVHLYRITSDPADLQVAVTLADESIDNLYENGWFKGHSGKPYYETTDGVGLLLCGLLELAETLETAG